MDNVGHLDTSPDASSRTTAVARVEGQLSSAQESLWFLEQFDSGTSRYSMPHAFRLTGELSKPALESALDAVVRRHEILRANFIADERGVRQIVSEHTGIELSYDDLASFADEQRTAELQSITHSEAERIFNLARDRLFVARLVRISRSEHMLLLNVHHIVFDGASLNILLAELGEYYRAAVTDRTAALLPLPTQYAGYAAVQRQWMYHDEYRKQLNYWCRQLDAAPERLALPIAERSRAAQGNASECAFDIPEPVISSVRKLCRAERVTSFMLFLATFQALLARYSGQSDIMVGTPVRNRLDPDVEPLIGLFVNTLVLRGDLQGNPSFRQFLKGVRGTVLDAYEHQAVPFDRIVSELRPNRDAAHNPLFQVSFGVTQGDASELAWPGVRIEPLEIENPAAKFDLSLVVDIAESRTSAKLIYRTDLFSASAVQRMGAHFTQLLTAFLGDPDLPVTAPELTTSAERDELLAGLSGPGSVHVGDAPLHELFRNQAEKTPDQVAVEFCGRHLTYGELDRRSDQLAHHLVGLGVGVESRIGIYLSRSPELLIGILAVLKAGAAYVPLDITLPMERIRHMIEDSRAAAIITRNQLRSRIAPIVPSTVNLDDASVWAGNTASPVLPPCSGNNTAYVIYTSGSTGKPKGVCCPHSGVRNVIADLQARLEIVPGTRCSFWCNVSFDVSVCEIFSALLNGGLLHIVDEEVRADGQEFLNWMRDRAIESAYVPPFTLDTLRRRTRQDCRISLNRLLVGVEPIPEAVLHDIKRQFPGLRVLNGYGPTETTIHSVIYSVEDELSVERHTPIGQAIENTRLYVLDAFLRSVPFGLHGELYIGGAGLARGYEGKPELTAARFVPNPYATTPGERMYRTGDIVAQLPDGNLAFIGRTDHQVKFRGVRIETEEIESVLRAYGEVRNAIVVMEKIGGEDALVACVVGADGKSLPDASLRAHLHSRLPHYMVPATFVPFTKLPLSPNGKVDRETIRRSLRDLPTDTQVGSEPPRDALERTIAGLFEEVLGISPVGRTDNFFALGGQSFLAVRLLYRINRECGSWLALSTLFEGPTVEYVAGELQADPNQSTLPLVPLRPKGSRAPLFLAHPVGGLVSGYGELIQHMPEEQPTYGLRAPGIDSDQDRLSSIEAMASRYADAVSDREAEGPYHLAGWSMGGLIAFEMARQLRNRGRSVGLLALFDSRLNAEPPTDECELLREWVYDLNRREFSPGQLERLAPADRWGAVLNLIHGDLPENSAELERHLETYRANVTAAANYEPGTYDGDVLLFVSEPDHARAQDIRRDWERVITGAVEMHMLSANHFTLLREPVVGTVARRVRAGLDAFHA